MKRSDCIALLVAGAALAPLTQQWLEPADGVRASPVRGAVGLIAVLAKLSAIARFTALSRQANS